MALIIAAELTPLNRSIHQEGNYLLVYDNGVVVDELSLNYADPDVIYNWVRVYTGFEKHDFKFEIEYPPFHMKHPKGMLPEVLGEKRGSYKHTFE